MPSADPSGPQGFTALPAKSTIQDTFPRGVKRLEPVDGSDHEGGQAAHSSPVKKKKKKSSSRKKEKLLAKLARAMNARVPTDAELVRLGPAEFMSDNDMESEAEAAGPAPTPTPSPVLDDEKKFIRRLCDSSPITYPPSSDDERARSSPSPTPTRAPAVVFDFADEPAADDADETTTMVDADESASDGDEVTMVDAEEVEGDEKTEVVEETEEAGAVEEVDESDAVEEAEDVDAVEAVQEGTLPSGDTNQSPEVISNSDTLVAFLLGFLAGFVDENNASDRLVTAIRAEIDRLTSRRLNSPARDRRRRFNAVNMHWRLAGMRLIFKTFKGDYDAIAARLEVLEQNHEALKVKVKRLRNRTQRDTRSLDVSIEHHTECLNKVHEAHEAATGDKLW